MKMLEVILKEKKMRRLPIAEENKSNSGDKILVRYINFIPGANSISANDWSGIKKTNEKNWFYYGSKFEVIGNEESEMYTDKGIDYKKINDSELSKLVSNVSNVKRLRDIKNEAIKAGKSKRLIHSIDAQIKKIADIDKKFQKAKEDREF